MKKRSLSPAQLQEREEKKQRFAGIVRRVSEMTDEARAEFAAKLPVVVTCEGHPLSLRNTLLLAFQSAEPCSIVGGFRQWRLDLRELHGGDSRRRGAPMQLIARAVYLIDVAEYLARRCWRNYRRR